MGYTIAFDNNTELTEHVIRPVVVAGQEIPDPTPPPTEGQLWPRGDHLANE